MAPLEAFLQEVYAVHSTGAGVPETSYYPALSNLLNAIGGELKPRVHCVINIQNRGAGLPDGGLFTPDQFQREKGSKKLAEPLPGQPPARGVMEVKSPAEDAATVADGEQVARYCGKYRQVLVTNLREWILVGLDPGGTPTRLESYRLAAKEEDFWQAARQSKATAERHAVTFGEFLRRALLHAAPLADPKDVAWFMASYARTALARVEASHLAALGALRKALEESLGVRFEGTKGEHFFRSTLVQTLFYGVFSSWVLWHKQLQERKGSKGSGMYRRFNWHEAEWSLRVPMIRALFHQVAAPDKLEPLGLVEILDWTSAVLNRVDRAAFFSKFEEHHAVQYFYEPFLEAFDPDLRKELGVWYTPPEVVQYMVSRVDTVLREELDTPDGLADPRVYVLDPCCGTGAYLVEVLRRIGETLKEKGGDALASQDLKRAAMERVFGFEILPAPFVVAHLQMGLLLQTLKAPLLAKNNERVGVYLTNALTGWDPLRDPKSKFLFPEMEDEREAADKIKRDTPILVILGNPPYNGFAGVAVEEERELSKAYRETKRAPEPQGQGLNDLYVRFFRMAERRIVEMNKPAKGVVCFISNYSWLDGLSFTGMRERYLESFDQVWVDCLNGDKYKTGKVTPEGAPDPSVFSTEYNREGIQVGTAVTLMVRREKHGEGAKIGFRHFWGKTKRADLVDASGKAAQKGYKPVAPILEMGLSFMPAKAESGYFKWPLLPELFPTSFPGVKTSRDDFLVDVDRDRLLARLERYFDPKINHDELRRAFPGVMTDTARYKAEAIRDTLRKRGLLNDNVARYCYRPFDIRWVYWEPETKLLDEKREDYWPHVFKGNNWLSAGQRNRKEDFYQPQITPRLADHHIVESNVGMFPLYLLGQHLPRTEDLFESARPEGKTPNLSDRAKEYLKGLKVKEPEPLFFHALSVLHAPQYREENAGALRQDWPRVPLPADRKALESSAELGRELATLLDPESPAKGVTTGTPRPELKVLAPISRDGGGTLDPSKGELCVSVGWGHGGKGGVVMPGKGKAVARDYTGDERAAIQAGAKALGLKPEQAFALLGETTLDVYLNGTAYWKNVPVNVWDYTLGGYQVLKKWLSYREHDILGRDLKIDEARYFTEVARRIAAILLLTPKLDENYAEAKGRE